jgi:outer membrane murein-binding lipoprotein Lpp
MSDMVTGEAFEDRLDRLTEVVERLATRVEQLTQDTDDGSDDVRDSP